MPVVFDTLEYAKRLKSVGFTEQQAEAQVEVLADIIEEKLATKQDIAVLQKDMKEIEKNMKEMETSLRRDMKELETSLRRDMKELELRLKKDLTLRLGAMIAASIIIIGVLVKLL